jgi:hypothetical protein
MQAETSTDLADDLLVGAGPIRDFLGPHVTERQVYHLAERGALPVIRRPGSKLLFARKSELRKAFSAEAAAG